MRPDWEKTQNRELGYWLWHFTEHTPFTNRDQVLGYMYHWGRQQARQCGLPGTYGIVGLPLDELLAGSILDVGCGPVSVHELRPRARVTAIDPLMHRYIGAMPNISRWKGQNDTEYLAGDIHGASLMHRSFDIVWCYNVLDHANDWRSTLARCCEFVGVGKMLVVGVDCREALDDTMAMHPSVVPYNDLITEVEKGGLSIGWITSRSKKQKQRVGLWADRTNSSTGRL